MSIVLRRSQRSTRVPASGPSRTPGSTKNIEMSAYWVISPVFCRTQTPSAKLVKPEPMNEITCPNHTAAKAVRQGWGLFLQLSLTLFFHFCLLSINLS